MNFNYPAHRVLTVFFLTLIFFLIAQTFCLAAKKDKQKDYVMTEIELQSELMSYADRFASILAQSFEDFDALGPSPESRRFVLDDMVHAISSAFTTAAEPNPQTALLDMVTIATLGRMIYEDNIRRRYGKPIEVMAKGFGELEKDIWQIAAKILSIEQQHEVRGLIVEWRKQNPDKIIYNYFRFSDFAADRRKSTLVKKDQTGGLFKSVQQATQQVEETRMLAERGLYLATRLPLLTGAFSEVWMTQLLVNPEAQKILQDLHGFSDVSQRLATVAEQLPDQLMKDISKQRRQAVNQVMKGIDKWSEKTLDEVMARVAIEREAFINQFMNRLIGEQKIALDAILMEEERVSELVTELRKAIEGGNNLLLTANTLAEKFNVGQPSDAPKDSRPFDIKEYQDTIAEVTTLVETTNQLVGTVGLEELLPQLINAIDRVEGEGEELIDHSFRQGVLFILIAMGAYVIARLIYNFLNKKLIESRA
ncbi:MAG: hypothetical protein JRD84_09465 [Deltaproteobacteria bacterium]|nr:hypothetical protein [Deltaproteobacteria bacterium]